VLNKVELLVRGGSPEVIADHREDDREGHNPRLIAAVRKAFGS
jgi:hypothetical protein